MANDMIKCSICVCVCVCVWCETNTQRLDEGQTIVLHGEFMIR